MARQAERTIWRKPRPRLSGEGKEIEPAKTPRRHQGKKRHWESRKCKVLRNAWATLQSKSAPLVRFRVRSSPATPRSFFPMPSLISLLAACLAAWRFNLLHRINRRQVKRGSIPFAFAIWIARPRPGVRFQQQRSLDSHRPRCPRRHSPDPRPPPPAATFAAHPASSVLERQPAA